ncbi:MAG: head-tail connector protein [Gelidibacter sp.]|nr:head-tail connector protein [Gelidibacter sp.]
MAYLDLLPLATMKTYLKIDDTLTETDAEITSMIKSAFSYIERRTNNILVQQATKEYLIKDRCVRVYDYPINSVVKGIDDDGDDVTLTYKTNYSIIEKPLYTIYNNIDGEAIKLVLNVGYADASDVPTEFIDLAKVIVKVMFYEQETQQSFKEMLPGWAVEILNTNKRFLI